MKVINKILLVCTVLLLCCGNIFAQQGDDKVIFDALKQELSREMEGLKLPDYTTPYYMSYLLKNTEYMAVIGSLGVIVSEQYIPSDRHVGMTMYTGDYQMNSDGNYMPMYFFSRTGVDDNPDQIRRDLWLMSDGLYKAIAGAYQNKDASLKRQTITDRLPDMIKTEPVTAIDESATGLNLDQDQMRSMVKELSAILLEYPDLYNSMVAITAMEHTTYLVNSEGSQIKQPVTLYSLSAHAMAATPEGTEISESVTEIVPAVDLAAVKQEWSEKIQEMAKKAMLAKDAPSAEEYYFGPVLFEDAAAFSTFTSSLLSNRTLFGYRKPVDAQSATPTLANRVGRKVMDTRFTITNRTDLTEYNGKKLVGAYDVDVEGVKPPESITLVEKGIFRRTLNSRVPTDISSESTGSMRFGTGASPMGGVVLAPGVLHIKAEGNTSTIEELREKLIENAIEEGNKYAYVVRSLGGNPKLYSIDVETREEKLVRNVNSISPPAFTKLDRLLGISDTEQVVNFQLGSVPTTMICPTAILVEDIEITPRDVKTEKLFFTTSPLKR